MLPEHLRIGRNIISHLEGLFSKLQLFKHSHNFCPSPYPSILLPFYCCKKNCHKILGGFHNTNLLSFKSIGQKLDMAFISENQGLAGLHYLLEALGDNAGPCILCLAEATHIPCLLACLHHPQSNNLGSFRPFFHPPVSF